MRGTVRALTDGFAVVELLTEGKEAVLSKEKADQLRKWDLVAKAHAAGELVDGTVVAKVAGGFSVDIGLRAGDTHFKWRSVRTQPPSQPHAHGDRTSVVPAHPARESRAS